MSMEWRGKGVAEEGVDAKTGRPIVRVDARYFRPTEVDTLLGDATKARTKLGWRPEIGLATLVEEMVEEDLQIARRDALVAREGFRTYRHPE
jgi:GDPmannose 4,6-dehydratase